MSSLSAWWLFLVVDVFLLLAPGVSGSLVQLSRLSLNYELSNYLYPSDNFCGINIIFISILFLKI